jgi:hypothetical protein
MGKIEWRRVVLGGLVAGLVLNIVDFLVHGVWLAEDWNAAMQALGRGEMTGAHIALLVVWDFVMGIFLVWLYAAIRPRFGPGPRAAAIAGFAAWFLIGLMNSIAQAPMELYPMRLTAISVVVGLAAFVLATVAGAYFYREDGGQAAAPMP